MRKSGILMAISSIPSKYGIGGFSKEAYEFVDFLEESGQKIWQILPLGPTGYGDSPYQSFSTFAGNPYYIDLESLQKSRWLTEEECKKADCGEQPGKVNYEAVYKTRFQVLRKAFKSAKAENISETEDYKSFLSENTFWLPDYCLYMALKESFGGICWIDWEEDIRLRKKGALDKYRQKLSENIAFYEFLQYIFIRQWEKLKRYANEKGIEIVGDIPIYVAFDSADTWANSQLFQLDEQKKPIAVAGCPPDAFSATGQLWGNPLYCWEYHRNTGYAWWIRRVEYCCSIYDIVRIDHFRGFDEYWSVPYGDETASGGHWEEGPGVALFREMEKKIGKKQIIAEDLGFLTPSVIQMVKDSGFPGMKVLQFAFDSREASDYMPYNYSHNCVVYTGTHDNETTAGWYMHLPEDDKRLADSFLNLHSEDEPAWEMIRTALASVADTAIIPMQDYIGLGNEARMNTPSTLGGNWEWRIEKEVLTGNLAKRIKSLCEICGRVC